MNENEYNVHLTIKNNHIEVDLNGHASKSHIIFLKLLKFKLVDDEKFSGKFENTIEIINDVIEYMNEQGVKFDSDSNIDDLIQLSDERTKLLAQSKELGEKVKQDKPHIIYPPNFNSQIKIKEYQFRPINHMLSVKHAANFSVPGSGKTLMTYAVFDILKSRNEIDSMLVVGPTVSLGPWEDEYEFCFNQQKDTKIMRYSGLAKTRRILDKSITEPEIILTTLRIAKNDFKYIVKNLLLKQRVMMVIDESHHIKSFADDATYAPAMIKLGKFATHRYILTGTPMPHSFADLWTQITFLWPHNDILGKKMSYKQTLDQLSSSRSIREELNHKIRFLWTRITNKQLKNDMPRILRPKIIEVRMSEKQQKIYRLIASDIRRRQELNLFENQNSAYKRNKILRLLQSVSNPYVMKYDDPDLELIKLKIDGSELSELVNEYDEISPKVCMAAKYAIQFAKKQNVVVWTTFIKNVKILYDVIKDSDPSIQVMMITGKTPLVPDPNKGPSREEILTKFKQSTNSILIATMGSIGESISLHRSCQRAIYLERNFNAGQYMQSLSRIYRIGSDKKNPVQFTFLKSTYRNDGHTVDEKIQNKLHERIDRLHELLNDEFEIHPISLETLNEHVIGSAEYEEDVDQFIEEIANMENDNSEVEHDN